MTTHANPQWCCDNVGGLGEHVTCHLFWFLSIPFFFLTCSIARSAKHQLFKLLRPILRFFAPVLGTRCIDGVKFGTESSPSCHISPRRCNDGHSTPKTEILGQNS